MTVIGLGSDLLRIDRVVQMGARSGDALLQRLLAPSEIDFAYRRGAPDWRRVAALVASKEAFFKALGTGLVQPLRWVDVAVGGSMRAPTLCWSGAAAAALAALGGVSARLSLSGDKIFTLATVILFDCQEAGPPGHVFAASPPGSEDPEPYHTALAHKRCTARVGGRLPQRP